jgi:tetratricopeptide (TPR) repeat protein
VVSVHHDYFSDFSESFDLGPFVGTHEVKAILNPLTYAIPISTNPLGARITVDGKRIGETAGGLGLVANVTAGTHRLEIEAPGYPKDAETIDIRPGLALTYDLAGRAAAKRQELARDLDTATALFQEQRYDEAIAECDAALQIDPQNTAVMSLRRNILQSKAILGAR